MITRVGRTPFALIFALGMMWQPTALAQGAAGVLPPDAGPSFAPDAALWAALDAGSPALVDAGPPRALDVGLSPGSAAEAPMDDSAGQAERDREAELFPSTGESPAQPGGELSGPDRVAQAREAELFGEGAEGAGDGQAASSERATSMQTTLGEGQDANRDSSTFERVAAGLEATSLGAFLYLRLDSVHVEGSAFKNEPLTAPALLDVFIDAGLSKDIRSYARGRVNYELLARKGGVLLDQLWVKFDVADTVFLTIGQQPVRWGAGRFFNPTDFLHPLIRDPVALFDARTGIPLVKAHVPVEIHNLSFYGIITFYDAMKLDQVGGALRAEMLLGPVEIDVTSALRRDVLQLGLESTLGAGPFEIRAESALFHNRANPACQVNESGVLESSPRDWTVQATGNLEAHVEYGHHDFWVLGGEYFYNQAGCSDTSIYPMLLLSGSYIPLRLGKHYAAAYSQLDRPGTWNNTMLLATWLMNMSDHSAMVRLDYNYIHSRRLIINVYAAYHIGQLGEFRLGFDVPSEVAAAAQLPVAGGESLRVAAPVVSAGLGVRSTF